MAIEPLEPEETTAEAVSSASTQMIEHARRSVAQVRSGGRGAGAGVVWDQGLVLTNYHVVARSRRGRRARVILYDERAFDAEVVKHERGLDLALLRIAGSSNDLPVATAGDSDALRVGEMVFGIGHPWGRLGAVTAGIVSGLGVVGGPGGRARYVQSDLSLAPGNSGGPLLNARGEVVGINAMIFGDLALSIPSNAASAWLNGAKKHRPRLGIGVRPIALPPAWRRGSRTGDRGLVIVNVERGGPADRAGLLVGDVLLGAADGAVDDAESLLDALARTGNGVRLRVMRSGKVSFVDVDLGISGPGRVA